MMQRIAVIIAFCLLGLNAWARPFTTEEKLADFESLLTQIRSGYGPLGYKQDSQGIELDLLVEEFRPRLAATASNKDFYYGLAEFISRYRDGHFNPSVPTTHEAELPVHFDLVGNKVLIESIDRTKLPEDEFPFVRGDELVRFDGRPVGEVVQDLMKYIQSGNIETVRHKAVWALSSRRGNRVPVSVGEVGETVIRRAQSGRSIPVKAGVLKWQEKGSPLFEAKEVRLARNASGTDYGVLSIRNELAELIGEKRLERTYSCNPGTRIAIPEGATILTHTDRGGPFVAYYHPDARFGGNVGYIRIPDYLPKNARGEEAYRERFQQYEWVVEQMERNTVGLVIDQDHNCGGSVEYLEQMLGLFLPMNYPAVQFQLLASPESYFDMKAWMEELPEFSRSRAWMEEVLKLVQTTYASGERMTMKTSITGRPIYEPNRVVYTKPIVMLINEMAGSGGDAFPAMLGGLGRVRLLGSQTAGLGGHVGQLQPLPFSRFGGRITKSLFFRPDGVAVENNGAIPLPDDTYTITYNDFVDEYREYQQFYLTRLLLMVRENEVWLRRH